MKRVVISGYYGFGNLGDEALLRAIVTGLRRRVDNLEIIVPSADPGATAAAHQITAVPRANPLLWWSLLGRCDLFISGGGSLLQDVTGPWNIPYYAGLMLMAGARGVPVMILGQGVGPIQGHWGRRLTRYAVDRAAIVTVRDPGSCELLRELGVAREITVVADPVFSLQFPQAAGRAPESNPGAPLRIGVALRRLGLTGEVAGRLAAAFDAVARFLGDGRVEFVFFPMQEQEDVGAAQMVAQQLTAPHRLISQRLSLDKTVELIATFDVVIAMRLHALILASLLGVPPAGISYDPKVEEFLRQVGAPLLASLPEVPSSGALSEGIRAFIADRRVYKDLLAASIPELRRKAEKPLDMAAQLLMKQ